jgi:outer membrane protein assembly factor BamB
MNCSAHLRVLVLTATIILPSPTSVLAQNEQSQSGSQADTTTTVHLRWGSRTGISRYRLQLARDLGFSDIVVDRVVSGNDYQIDDLSPGKYFWRIAPLTTKLGEFSSVGSIEVLESAKPLSNPPPVNDSSRTKTSTADPVLTRGGWRAAVGYIPRPVLANLRSSDRPDVVGINSDGVLFALDSVSGVSLWSLRGRKQNAHQVPDVPLISAPLLLRSRSGLHNIVVLYGTVVEAIEGASGRQLWRVTLPTTTSSGAVISDGRVSKILVVDSSRQRAFVVDGSNGNIHAQIRLPHRVIGAPISIDDQSARVMIAYDSGQVEVRNMAGAVICSGDSGSPATTPPLFIKDRSRDLILVGTKAGLTALAADDLRPLGMLATKDDAPRGTLAAQDLDGDGSPEVIMMTDRGRVVAVNAAEGRTLWETTVGNDGETVAFVDVNEDRVFDVVVAGDQSFALALSGRDGSVVWKDNQVTLVENRLAELAPRSIVAMPFGSGALVIVDDSSRTGLRAIEFPKGIAQTNTSNR